MFIKKGLQSKFHGLIGYEFGTLLDRLLKDEKKTFLFNGIDILLSHRFFEDEAFDKVYSIFQSYEFTRILTEYKEKLINTCGQKLLEISITKATEVLELDKSSFNNISIPAIENHEQTSFTWLPHDCIVWLYF